MKRLLSLLKIIIPLALGVFLIWYMLNSLTVSEKQGLKESMGQANYLFLILSFCFGVLAHISRAIRWRYMFEPFGKKIAFWNSFNAVMAGYFINLLAPRAGEPARAGFLAKNEDISFERSFGTIVAERVIDLVMLGLVFLLTMYLHLDRIGEFEAIIEEARKSQSSAGAHWFSYVFNVIVVLLGLALIYSIFNQKLRQKVKGILLGMWEGLKTIFTLKKKWLYFGHTLFIWLMYLAMFGICYPAMEATSSLPLSAVFAGFIAGAVGIVLVQGGLGVYPILVAAALTLYMGASPGKFYTLDGYAMGWLIWIPQTLLIILIGILCLISLQLKKKNVEGENS